MKKHFIIIECLNEMKRYVNVNHISQVIQHDENCGIEMSHEHGQGFRTYLKFEEIMDLINSSPGL